MVPVPEKLQRLESLLKEMGTVLVAGERIAPFSCGLPTGPWGIGPWESLPTP